MRIKDIPWWNRPSNRIKKNIIDDLLPSFPSTFLKKKNFKYKTTNAAFLIMPKYKACGEAQVKCSCV